MKFKKSKIIIFLLVAVLLAGYFIPKPTVVKLATDVIYVERNMIDRISTAWTYERPIPDLAVSNILSLANQNPNITVHVYCGSTQCIKAVSKKKNANMEVKFAAIGEIVKDMSNPLEEWLARHPVNKALAGREFETHLQDVTIIGILWKYGGIYVNPVLKLASGFNETNTSDTSAWIGELKPQLFENHQAISLDISYFTKNHPFIHLLADLYVSRYPTERSGNFQGYMTTVLSSLSRSICSTEKVFCPKVLNDVPAIISSEYSLVDPSQATKHFGIFSRSTSTGLDNRLQEFSTSLFLPFVDTIFDQKSTTSRTGNVSAFFNGFGRTVSWWQRTIDPIMVSICIQEEVDGSVEKIEYLKRNEPIGCTDTTTQDFLTKKGIRAFLSGSLMLLFSGQNLAEMQRHGIFFADLDSEVIKLLPTAVQNSAIHLADDVKKRLTSFDVFQRLKTTYLLIEKFKSVELVVTQCYHCASACAALGTPVIFVNTPESASLANGTTSLFHTLDFYSMSKGEAQEWLANFPWKSIPPNPDLALLMRLRATAWNVIRENPMLYDTAKKLGVIPMSPPYILPEDRKILFHMTFTSSSKHSLETFGSKRRQSGAFNWRHWRSVESVFCHHPTSHLWIHSNTLPQSMFDVLTEVGYNLTVRPYDLSKLLVGTPAESFIHRLSSARRGPFWIYKESDLMRHLAMYKWGGVYLDTDMYLVQPLYSLRVNGAGWQGRFNLSMNGAFLYFEKKHPFIHSILKNFVSMYKAYEWVSTGPQLLTTVWRNWNKTHPVIDKHAMQPYSYIAFYLIHYSRVKQDCFDIIYGKDYERYMRLLRTEAYGVHVNAKLTGHIGINGIKIKKGTICSYILNSFCVLCNFSY